jgi:hypothetical protein
MKSIYEPDDLRANDVGLDISYMARKFFKFVLEKYPDHNPREIRDLCSGEFEGLANRKILEWRKGSKKL